MASEKETPKTIAVCTGGILCPVSLKVTFADGSHIRYVPKSDANLLEWVKEILSRYDVSDEAQTVIYSGLLGHHHKEMGK